jgi:hypothetical protein
MKLNLDLIKDILSEVEQKGDGLTSHTISSQDYTAEDKRAEYINKVYHFKLLIEDRLVNGEIIKISYMGDDVPHGIRYKGLTMEGHRTLEAMRSDTIWNTIKGKTKFLGEEGLKQIPALALKMLLELFG